MSTKLLEEDGENRAVRTFLMLYGGQYGISIGAMRLHLTRMGFPNWPAWVETSPENMHLTKSGAQDWLRHLFALEETLKVSSDGSTLINPTWTYKVITPDNPAPRGVKMLLINKNLGSATLSVYNENDQFTHYAGLPKFEG